jgi:molybdopterin synthase sulfur carrier subunit
MSAGFIAEPGFFIVHPALWRFEMTTVYIPTPLRRLTSGQSKVKVQAQDITSLIQSLDADYPGFAERVLDDNGNVKRFIQVFRNDDEIRTLQGMETPVTEADRVSIVPAMAGGRQEGRDE